MGSCAGFIRLCTTSQGLALFLKFAPQPSCFSELFLALFFFDSAKPVRNHFFALVLSTFTLCDCDGAQLMHKILHLPCMFSGSYMMPVFLCAMFLMLLRIICG